MSTRAISNYLLENHKVKISPVTIAKALREAEKHWLAFYEYAQPAALVFGEFHRKTADEILAMTTEEFENLCNTDTIYVGVADKDQLFGKSIKHDRVKDILIERWFSFDDETRDTCLSSLPFDEPDEANKEVKGA